MLLLAPSPPAPPPSPAAAGRRSLRSSAVTRIRCSSVHELERSPAPRPGASLPPLPAAKRVVLVRHGQSTWNAEGRIQGSSDISVLTPKGESQAETSRLMLLSDSFDACFTSPLARSRRTAEIIWEGRDDDLISDSDLREIDLYSFQVGIWLLLAATNLCNAARVFVGMPAPSPVSLLIAMSWRF
jgi:hypothetical protein